MALNGEIEGTTSNKKITAKIIWSATQSIANNQSTITARLYYNKGNATGTTRGTFNGSLSIGGATKKIEGVYFELKPNSGDVLVSEYTVTANHFTDGTRDITLSASGGMNGTTFTSTSCSKSVTLNPIPRKATITNAPNFNDTDNPTITYVNSAGNAATTLQACIASDDVNNPTVYVSYKDIPKTDTSYTFSLSDDERASLYNAFPNSKSGTVRFYIKTILGGNTYTHSVPKTFSIINANPVLNPTVKDEHPNMVSFTGDENKFIKYYSNARYSIGAAAQKGATITSQKVTCGTKTNTAASGLIEDVESAIFTFFATDSRGNTTTRTITKTLVNYVKLTCNLQVEQPTTDGETTITITGNYFNSSFGVTNNYLKVWYRIKEGSGSYSQWYGITPTLKNNTYTVTKQLTGLDYKKQYTIQACAQDAIIQLTTDALLFSKEIKVKTLPIFDWGEDDFNFNVPVKFGGVDTIRRSDIGNTVIATKGGDGIYLRPNGTNEGNGQVVIKTDGKLTAGGYNLTGLAKAMSNVFTLNTTTKACTNYTVTNQYDSYLIGNTLRCRFYAERNTAVNGDIINEDVVTITVSHEGKIKNIYIDGITTVNQGAVANFYPDNITYDQEKNTITFTIILTATGSECSRFGSYFTLPCILNLDNY